MMEKVKEFEKNREEQEHKLAEEKRIQWFMLV